MRAPEVAISGQITHRRESVSGDPRRRDQHVFESSGGVVHISGPAQAI